jgi:quercetin dioxygenase-like cupin family protein
MRLVLPVIVLAVILSGCSAAAPTPEPSASTAPVTAVDLAAGTQEDGVDVEVAGPTQVAMREITIKPGAGTGEHCHYGQLIAVVEKGVFTHYAPIYPEGVHVYEAGDSIVEGSGYVHQGVNEGTEDVVLTVTYVIPAGEPLAETDLANCDPQ